MNKRELSEKIIKMGIPSNYYSFTGKEQGEQVILSTEDGKWRVYETDERNDLLKSRWFDTESQACAFFYQRMLQLLQYLIEYRSDDIHLVNNLSELQLRLDAIGLNRAEYALNEKGSKARYVLLSLKKEWQYREYDEASNLLKEYPFDTEKEACDFFFRRILKIQPWYQHTTMQKSDLLNILKLAGQEILQKEGFFHNAKDVPYFYNQVYSNVPYQMPTEVAYWESIIRQDSMTKEAVAEKLFTDQLYIKQGIIQAYTSQTQQQTVIVTAVYEHEAPCPFLLEAMW